MEDLKKNNDQVQKNKEKEKEKIKEKLKAVFDKYGYDDEERRKKILGLMVFNYCLNKTLEKTIFPDNYEVAKLIKVLRQCVLNPNNRVFFKFISIITIGDALSGAFCPCRMANPERLLVCFRFG